MKPFHLITVAAFLSCSSCGASEADSLRQMLAESITPGGVKEKILAEKLKSWPGRKTLNGVVALFDLRLSTSDGYERLAIAFIEEHLEVPPSEIASFLLSRAKAPSTDSYELMRYLDFMEPYANEAVIAKYYVSLLPDKRPLNRNQVPVEGGHIVRVCDVALKNLIKNLETRRLLKWHVTPGFVWDPLRTEDFEHNIVAITPYLIQAGIIEDRK